MREGIWAAVVAGWLVVCTASAQVNQGGYRYKGKQRTQKWFDVQYEEFKDKIAVVDGRPYDAGRALMRLEIGADGPGDCICSVPPQPGTEIRRGTGLHVFQVIEPGQILAVRTSLERRDRDDVPKGLRLLQNLRARSAAERLALSYTTREVLVHIKGIDTTQLVNGMRFSSRDFLVYCGVFRYESVAGPQQIQSYALWVPKVLSREMFGRVLASGFELIHYWKHRKRRVHKTSVTTPARKIFDNGIISLTRGPKRRTKRTVSYYYEVKAKPVP